MNLRFLTLACFATATTFAADAPKLPSIPTEPIAKKKELLFSDDFELRAPGWARTKAGQSCCRLIPSTTAR